MTFFSASNLEGVIQFTYQVFLTTNRFFRTLPPFMPTFTCIYLSDGTIGHTRAYLQAFLPESD